MNDPKTPTANDELLTEEDIFILGLDEEPEGSGPSWEDLETRRRAKAEEQDG